MTIGARRPGDNPVSRRLRNGFRSNLSFATSKRRSAWLELPIGTHFPLSKICAICGEPLPLASPTRARRPKGAVPSARSLPPAAGSGTHLVGSAPCAGFVIKKNALTLSRNSGAGSWISTGVTKGRLGGIETCARKTSVCRSRGRSVIILRRAKVRRTQSRDD